MCFFQANRFQWKKLLPRTV